MSDTAASLGRADGDREVSKEEMDICLRGQKEGQKHTTAGYSSNG